MGRRRTGMPFALMWYDFAGLKERSDALIVAPLRMDAASEATSSFFSWSLRVPMSMGGFSSDPVDVNAMVLMLLDSWVDIEVKSEYICAA